MPLKLTHSKELQQRAERYFPGGVNSPVRAFRAVGGAPPILERAGGAYLWDVDGNRYLDYFGSWGPMILGHAYPPVVEAIEQAARRGASFGASSPLEAELAEGIVAAFPSIEKLRFVSSGTEATMSAIRLARAYTGRKIVIKFEGCYHGHADGLLVKAGSGVATFGIPGSAGVPEETAHLTMALPFNDLPALEAAFAAHGREIACVIVEPVVGNMGCVAPHSGYLQNLREITRRAGAVLIFDEVMTGFRVAFGGAQEIFEIVPDMTCLGKIIGGGPALRGLWWKGRNHGHACAFRAGLPGGHSERQSVGHGGRDRDPASTFRASAGDLSGTREAQQNAGGRGRRRRAKERGCCDREPRGVDVHLVSDRCPGYGLCRRGGFGYGRLRALPSRHARTGSVAASLAI